MSGMQPDTAKPLFSYRHHWAHRFGTAPFLPMSRAEMDALGWDSCDIVLVTGDAYVDHPSFGMAIIGRLLEAQGFRVGIIAQPDWQSAEPFKALGQPSAVLRRHRRQHGFDGQPLYRGPPAAPQRQLHAGRRGRQAARPRGDRLCPALPRGVPRRADRARRHRGSLRRIAHYDYWSDKVRRSILVDAKADILLYGNAERAVVEVAHRLAKGDSDSSRASTTSAASRSSSRAVPDGWTEAARRRSRRAPTKAPGIGGENTVIRLPAFEQVEQDREAYARASRVLHRESNPGNARALVQRHGDRELWLTPPPIPLTTAEMDAVYDLPYARAPHPSYGEAKIPAWDMIHFSVTIMRGCFGGCTFCSITEHEGRIIQNRSEDSVVREIETDPRQDAGLHRHHLRYRRPDRQHVPHGLQGQEDRGGVPAAVLRLSRHLPEPRHLPRRADRALPQGARRAGREEGDGRVGRALRSRGRKPGHMSRSWSPITSAATSRSRRSIPRTARWRR